MSLFTDTNWIIGTLLHDLLSQLDITSEDIVSHKVLADECSNDLSSMNADLEVRISNDHISHISQLFDYVQHVKSSQNDVVSFFNLQILIESFLFGHLSIVAHKNVHISVRMHFVNLSLLTDFIKLIEYTCQLLYNI